LIFKFYNLIFKPENPAARSPDYASQFIAASLIAPSSKFRARNGLEKSSAAAAAAVDRHITNGMD
jgi:hypothetical protein